MNRAERRRAKKAGIPVKKEPVVNIKAADVQKIKLDASKEAADKAFLLMLGLPVMVLHDTEEQANILKRSMPFPALVG